MVTKPSSDPEIVSRRRTLHRFLVAEMEYAAPAALAVVTLAAMLLAHHGWAAAIGLAIVAYVVTHLIAKRFLIH